MARPEFMQLMKKTIAEQRHNAEQHEQQKSHDDQVTRDHEFSNWEELNREVKVMADELGLGYAKKGRSFTLSNGERRAEITLDHAIKYSVAGKNGSFAYVVSGGNLKYSERRPIGDGTVAAVLTVVGEELDIAEVAERLVKVVVSE